MKFSKTGVSEHYRRRRNMRMMMMMMMTTAAVIRTAAYRGSGVNGVPGTILSTLYTNLLSFNPDKNSVRITDEETVREVK